MWHVPNPNALPELAHLRAAVARQRQTPTGEWPLHFDEQQDVLFVVRTWPDGAVTAYTMPAPVPGDTPST